MWQFAQHKVLLSISTYHAISHRRAVYHFHTKSSINSTIKIIYQQHLSHCQWLPFVQYQNGNCLLNLHQILFVLRINGDQMIAHLSQKSTASWYSTCTEVNVNCQQLFVTGRNEKLVTTLWTEISTPCNIHTCSAHPCRSNGHIQANLILSRIDYCNALLHGAPAATIHKLQRVQNNAARIVVQAPKTIRCQTTASEAALATGRAEDYL